MGKEQEEVHPDAVTQIGDNKANRLAPHVPFEVKQNWQVQQVVRIPRTSG